MREETQQYPTCVYCKQPIPNHIYKRLDTGEAAHVTCYLDHTEKEGNDVGRLTARPDPAPKVGQERTLREGDHRLTRRVSEHWFVLFSEAS